MRNLLIASGGMKLYGDDLEFMQHGIRDALTSVIKRFADARNGKMILSGCIFVPTGDPNVYAITNGWVMISYELLYFQGATYTFSGTIDFASVELESYDYDNSEPNAYRDVNGVSYTPWKMIEARLKTTALNTLSMSDNNRIENVMREVIGGSVEVVANTLTLVSGITLAASTTVKLSKNDNKALLMANLVTDSTDYTPVGGAKIASLPSGFAPVLETVYFGSNSSRGLALIYLKTNGDIFFENRAGGGFTPGSTVFLNAQYYTV